MNGMWGYKIKDQNYKDTKTLIRYLVKTAGMGANLLLNIGPQPNGELPEAALNRLKEIGQWMNENGETIYGTKGAPFNAQSWGTATIKDNRLFLHVMTPETDAILVPGNLNLAGAKEFATGKPLKMQKVGENNVITIDYQPDSIDYIIECSIEN